MLSVNKTNMIAQRETLVNSLQDFFVILGIELRALNMPGNCSTTELHAQS
jgi:hypothetical protein